MDEVLLIFAVDVRDMDSVLYERVVLKVPRLLTILF